MISNDERRDDLQGYKMQFYTMTDQWFTSPPLDPIEPKRNLAGDEQTPPPPFPDDCLLRPPGLLTQIGWSTVKLAHLLEGRVADEFSAAELCLKVSGKLLAGTVIVWTDPSGVSISIWMSSVTV